MNTRDARILAAVQAFGEPMLAEIRAHRATVDAYRAEIAAAYATVNAKLDQVIDVLAELRRDFNDHTANGHHHEP